MAGRLTSPNSSLERLCREGLLPVDGQQHRAGLRGSESLYPRWAVDQLELVARLMVEERRSRSCGCWFAGNGGWVRPDKLRASLIRLLEAMSAQAQRMTANTSDQNDRADRLAEAMTLWPR